MSCKCQGCGRQYKIDLLISDELWEKIKPKDKLCGGGLLCGGCIIERLECLNGYGAWKIVPNFTPQVVPETFDYERPAPDPTLMGL